MNRNRIVLAIILTMLLAFSAANAQPYVLVSMNEHDGDVPNILPPGEYQGSIHSNDAFTFGYLPLSIQGIVTSASDHINYANGVEPGDVNLANDPEFNLPPITLPENADWIRDNADIVVPSYDNRYMTWIVCIERIVIYIYQYPRGGQRSDSLYRSIHYWGSPHNIFVDGDCEVQGNVYGKLVIGCSGDMYLLDNIKYAGANGVTGDFDEDEMHHSLQLVSEGDIIIANTERNGRADGIHAEPNDFRRNSIAINGTLVALGGSVRIEDTNADWEDYQGPEPDERGTVYLKGTIFARDGINLWNDNHGGTGYNVEMRPDNRLPYNFDFLQYINSTMPLILGGNQQFLDHPVIGGVQNGVVNDDLLCYSLYATGNSKMYFLGPYQLTVLGFDPFQFQQTESLEVSDSDTVEFLYPDWEEGMPFARILVTGDQSSVSLSKLFCGEGIEIYSEALTVSIDSCQLGKVTLYNAQAEDVQISESTFSEAVSIHVGSCLISNCQFNAPVSVYGWKYPTFSHNLFQAGLTIDGNPRQCNIDHCTITNPGGAGLFLDLYREVNISNSIIANCEAGIVNDHWETPAILYSDIYGNSEGDLIDCNPGEGCLSLDPLFLDAMNSDYHLQPGSPCVDAGDPNSPNDPDDSRADMGAFPFDHAQDIAHDATMPSAFVLSSPFPNPFNSTTTIGYSLPAAGAVSLTVYDLSGREVARLADGVKPAGTHEAVWVAGGISSGVYVVRLVAGGVSAREKVVLVR